MEKTDDSRGANRPSFAVFLPTGIFLPTASSEPVPFASQKEK